MRRRMRFDGEWYYLKGVSTYKRDADTHADDLRGRGYRARVKNIPEGWGVYYR